jgi:hypothetical protein
MLTTIALIVASATASAETLGRSITGEPVTTDSAVALVFWSMECSDCGARMSDLEEAGVPMIAINTDAANQAAALRAFSARFDRRPPATLPDLRRCRHPRRGKPHHLAADRHR